MANQYAPDAKRCYPAPFIDDSQHVVPDWIDYNGHMSVIYYLPAFERAFSTIYKELALGRELIEATGISIFTTEQHITFKKELFSGDPLLIITQLIDVGEKGCQWFQTMFHAKEGYLASTCEHLMLFVDVKERRSTKMPMQAAKTLGWLMSSHGNLPKPADVGRRIALSIRA